MRQLPRWINRNVALAVLVGGAILILLWLLAYGEQAVESYCNDGRSHDVVGSGACTRMEGLDRTKGDDGYRMVDTFLGTEQVPWVGITRWPALLLGFAGVLSGLVGFGATTLHAFGFGSSASSETPPAPAPRPIGELGLLEGDSQDLRVKIIAHDDGYIVNVSSSFTQGDNTLHADALPVDRGLADLNQLQANTSKRRIGSKRAKAVEAFGARLFDAIFDGPTERAYRQSVNFVREHNGTLRISLEVDEKFADLPWEYLYDDQRGTFLALSHDTSLSRRIESIDATRSHDPIACLRVLVMTASPAQVKPLDVAGERGRIEANLAAGVDQGSVRLDFVEGGSLAALQEALKDVQPHVFHFVGHGAWSEEHDDGVLYFEDDMGFQQPVTGRNVGALLNRPEMRLAIFNSCNAARRSKDDRFAGVSSSVVAQGVPASIGMQFSFDDQTAATFGATLLSELAAGAAVDVALTDARIAVHAIPNDVEWGTPVLTTRVDPDLILPRS